MHWTIVGPRATSRFFRIRCYLPLHCLRYLFTSSSDSISPLLIRPPSLFLFGTVAVEVSRRDFARGAAEDDERGQDLCDQDRGFRRGTRPRQMQRRLRTLEDLVQDHRRLLPRHVAENRTGTAQVVHNPTPPILQKYSARVMEINDLIVCK